MLKSSTKKICLLRIGGPNTPFLLLSNLESIRSCKWRQFIFPCDSIFNLILKIGLALLGYKRFYWWIINGIARAVHSKDKAINSSLS